MTINTNNGLPCEAFDGGTHVCVSPQKQRPCMTGHPRSRSQCCPQSATMHVVGTVQLAHGSTSDALLEFDVAVIISMMMTAAAATPTVPHVMPTHTSSSGGVLSFLVAVIFLFFVNWCLVQTK